MKMLPTLAPGTTITENGHYLVRPVGNLYEVVNAVTDEPVVSKSETGDIPLRYSVRSDAEFAAILLALASLDLKSDEDFSATTRALGALNQAQPE